MRGLGRRCGCVLRVEDNGNQHRHARYFGGACTRPATVRIRRAADVGQAAGSWLDRCEPCAAALEAVQGPEVERQGLEPAASSAPVLEAARPAAPTFYGPLPFRAVQYHGADAEAFVSTDGVTRRLRAVDGDEGGFEWGYLGGGPTALARALLADFLGFVPNASIVLLYRNQVIARLRRGQAWTIDAGALRQQLREVAGALSVDCLRCSGDRSIYEGAGERRPCPVCCAGVLGEEDMLRSDAAGGLS